MRKECGVGYRNIYRKPHWKFIRYIKADGNADLKFMRNARAAGI